MNIETDLVKKKEFSTSINSGIQKHSQEYKALAILRYLYPQKFSTMINGEAPDLQDNENGVSISIHVVDALWSAFSNVCPDSVKIGFPGWDIGMVPQIKTVAGTQLL